MNRKRRFGYVLSELSNIQWNEFAPSKIKIDTKLECKVCKQKKSLAEFNNHQSNAGRHFKQSYCKSCAHNKKIMQRKTNFISGLVNGCKYHAQRRGNSGRPNCNEVTITKKDILDLAKKQNYRCAVSNVKLKWARNSGWKKASIDRIDNDRGYTLENIRLTAWGVNAALHTWEFEDFLKMCRKVTENNSKENNLERKVVEKSEKENIIIPRDLRPKKVVKKATPIKNPSNKKCLDCQKPVYRTSTRCGSCSSKFHNKRKVQNRPSKEALRELLKENSYCALGRLYGVSDNAVRKWLK